MIHARSHALRRPPRYDAPANANAARQVPCPDLSEPFMLDVRLLPLDLAEAAAFCGIGYGLPPRSDIVPPNRTGITALATFGMFDAARPVTVPTMRDSLYRQGWLPVSVQALLAFGRQVRPSVVRRDLVAIGTQFNAVLEGCRMASFYPCLKAQPDGTWSLQASTVQQASAISAKAHLYWRPVI